MDTRLLQQQHPGINIQWVDSIASTQSAVQPNSLLIAEHQDAGVGRRGNKWLTPSGQSICFSYRFNLSTQLEQMSGYALIIAISTIQTLLKYEPNTQAQLKWPNDLYVNDRKFGGILINLTAKKAQQIDVTVGIGINWTLSTQQLNSIDQPVANIPIRQKPERAEFISQLLKQIKINNTAFLNNGLTDLLRFWQPYDYLSGKTLTILQGNQSHFGQYIGIDATGQLLASIDGQIKSFNAAEISVRNHV